ALEHLPTAATMGIQDRDDPRYGLRVQDGKPGPGRLGVGYIKKDRQRGQSRRRDRGGERNGFQTPEAFGAGYNQVDVAVDYVGRRLRQTMSGARLAGKLKKKAVEIPESLARSKPPAWLTQFASPYDLIILTNTATASNSSLLAAHFPPYLKP